jgi:hypothetical protein
MMISTDFIKKPDFLQRNPLFELTSQYKQIYAKTSVFV